MSENVNNIEGVVDEERRNFIHIAAGTAVLGGVGLIAYMAVDQMNPAADTKAASAKEIDISLVAEGEEIRVLIAGKPFFVRRRTPAEIRAAREVKMDELIDPQTDDERLRPDMNGKLNPSILVTSAACTHLGCVPSGPGSDTGNYGGWYCPCHGSHYDTSGRIRQGPAPTNLPIPNYVYTSEKVIRISL